MIELGIFPVVSIMTLRAVGAVRARMLIIFGMTTDAGLRRALKCAIDVALLTLDRDMLALKFEGRLRVIEGDRLPIVRGVARRTIGAVRAVVLVVLAVTIDAGGRGRREVGHGAHVGVTFATGHFAVFADQRKL